MTQFHLPFAKHMLESVRFLLWRFSTSRSIDQQQNVYASQFVAICLPHFNFFTLATTVSGFAYSLLADLTSRPDKSAAACNTKTFSIAVMSSVLHVTSLTNCDVNASHCCHQANQTPTAQLTVSILHALFPSAGSTRHSWRMRSRLP